MCAWRNDEEGPTGDSLATPPLWKSRSAPTAAFPYPRRGDETDEGRHSCSDLHLYYAIRSCSTGQNYTPLSWMELEIKPRKRTAHFETWSEGPLHRSGHSPQQEKGGESWDVTVKTKNTSSMWPATTLNLYTQHIEEGPTLDTSSATTPLNPHVENAQVDGYLNVHQRRGFRTRREETRDRRGATCLFPPFSSIISNFFVLKKRTGSAVAQQQLCKKIFL
jgi:hypothetical protein